MGGARIFDVGVTAGTKLGAWGKRKWMLLNVQKRGK